MAKSLKGIGELNRGTRTTIPRLARRATDRQLRGEEYTANPRKSAFSEAAKLAKTYKPTGQSSSGPMVRGKRGAAKTIDNKFMGPDPNKEQP